MGALLHSRQAAVGDCLTREGGSAYRAFRRAAARRDGAAARDFIEKGFPPDLLAAATRCDVSLTYDFAQSERIDFGMRVLGWR